jgi:mono/diheme cytochrome c family protein
MKKLCVLFSFISLLMACGGAKTPDNKTESTPAVSEPAANPKYDPNRGQGKWTADNVQLGATLDPALVAEGGKIRDVKCASCHKLTGEKLVGPGWKGVTQRRRPEWIMNFITNPDPMIEKDPVVQAELELCLVRMPNQNLSDSEARAILEFMRSNDGVH